MTPKPSQIDIPTTTASPPEQAKLIVWAMCTAKYNQPTEWGEGDEMWAAFTDNGEPITSHYSSNRWFGEKDVSPQRKPEAYLLLLGTCDPERIDYRVIPHGQALPHDVLQRGVAAGYLEVAGGYTP